jgi:hypothetical protein
MTDTPPNSSVPQPRPSDNRTDPRQAALHTLAALPTPAAPPGPAGVLTDRVLVYTSWDAGQKLLKVLSPQASGLVLRGRKACAGVRQLRRNHFGGVLLIDPEGYTKRAATAEAPFALSQDEDQLFETTLDDILQGQRICGATVALTPTGYLHAGDSDALKAAANTVADLDRDDVLFSVPIDIAWLTNDHISQLIAVLSRLAAPKAVFLGGQFDPLDRYQAAVANLRRLVAEAGHVAVFRTDLTGFDALTHGAFAASIGTGGSLRHVIPFGEYRRARTMDQSPSVLFPDVMAFFKGSTLAQRFANARPPACSCSACQGRRLDTFLGRADAEAAHSHGVCTWIEWITDMLAQPTLADRAQWWRNRCAAAVAHHDNVNAQLDQPDAFKPPKALKAWADLPAWPSTTEPAPRRSRTR